MRSSTGKILIFLLGLQRAKNTLQKSLQNQILSPRTLLQQLPQNCTAADLPPRKQHCLRDTRLELVMLFSGPLCAPELSPLN